MLFIIQYLSTIFSALLLSGLANAQTINPVDKNIIDTKNNPAVLLYENFEDGWGKWNYPASDTPYLTLVDDSVSSHSGRFFLRSEVSENDLISRPRISSKTRYIFDRPSDEIYLRFFTRFNSGSPTPHHWIKLAATDGFFDVRGKAGVRPAGNQATWFDIDINNSDKFSFFVYWHEMRSGRCNDGSAKPGCAGDQGRTYYYGNKFKPADQTPMKRDQWFCVEIHAKLNDIGKSNGELSLWINDKEVGTYKTGTPTGTWLRARFHSDGCKYPACKTPTPFSGFNFRTSEKVKFREIYMDAYYQLDTFKRKRAKLEKAGKPFSSTQTIDYDDIIVSTKRIGCTPEPHVP